MQLSDKEKKEILEGFIDIFTRISNKEYQKRIWVKGEGAQIDDFDDTVCDFFGECDAILENYKNFGITDHQYELLIKFRDEFRNFSNKRDLQADFLDFPEWGEIIKKAKEILKVFNYHKSKPVK